MVIRQFVFLVLAVAFVAASWTSVIAPALELADISVQIKSINLDGNWTEERISYVNSLNKDRENIRDRGIIERFLVDAGSNPLDWIARACFISIVTAIDVLLLYLGFSILKEHIQIRIR